MGSRTPAAAPDPYRRLMSAASQRPAPVTLRAQSWGQLAATYVQEGWVGQLWEANEQGIILVDVQGCLIHLVTPLRGEGPFNIVLPPASLPSRQGLHPRLRTWRSGDDLWIGEGLVLRLPSTPPWSSTLDWSQERPVTPETLGRHLALLADWLMARAPEATLGGLLPELLIPERTPREIAARPDLNPAACLFRRQVAQCLKTLLPALVEGDLAHAERAMSYVAGLGPGMPPAGDYVALGLVAGLHLWTPFMEEGSGLHVEALGRRLLRIAAERTTRLGCATLQAALEGHWGQRWHILYYALTQADRYPDRQWARIEQIAAGWLAQELSGASAALSGLLLPFLWHQRFLR